MARASYVALFLGCILLAQMAAAKKPDNKPPKKECPNQGPGLGQCVRCKGKKCDTCNQPLDGRGYYASPKGECRPCTDVACKVCNKSSGTCKACLAGFALDGSKCIPCVNGVDNKIVSKGRCKCATGYKFDAARNCVLEVPVPPTRKMKL